MSDQYLELYLHIPFCLKKCAYCDFLSFQGGKEVQEKYVNALIREIEAVGSKNLIVSSIYLGGGTPSTLSGEQIGRVMECVMDTFCILPSAEISMECNPGTVTEEKLLAYRSGGVNRISFGLQSAHNDELKKLGRIHTWETFLESFQLARKMGYTNINVDVMSGLPEQTVDQYLDTLKRVVDLKPEHISAYSLILEEGTPFYQIYYDTAMEEKLPDEETERRMYWKGRQLLEEYGYHCYEISNYAKPSKACIHNIGYWTGREYLGMGLGASSLFLGKRFHNTSSMDTYLTWADQPKKIRVEEACMTKKRAMEEFAFLGLRLTEGINTVEFERRFGCMFQSVYGKVTERFLNLGFLVERKGKICLTNRGIDVSNQIMAEFLMDGE